MKNFLMASERVGESILGGARLAVGNDDFLCAQYLARLLADFASKDKQLIADAESEVTQLYKTGFNNGG